MTSRVELFATCPRGLEAVLHAELKERRFARIERQVGGCRFEGDLADVARANLCLRTANRVLMRVARFPCEHDDQLYREVREIPWERWLRPDGTLRVQARVQDSTLTHGRFAEQRIKDAICDRFLARDGRRPTVGDEESDLRVHLHLYRDRATLSLDSTGPPLYKRGWRVAQGRAPLPETLAAGIVLLSGWNLRAPVVDPFCGSGTLLVEAGLIAAGAMPGAQRTFGFERWLGHDASRYHSLREGLLGERRATPKLTLMGSDVSAERVEEARTNLEAAGIEARLELEPADARRFHPRRGWNAQILTNLPWGVRVSDPARVEALYRAFGERLRASCSGYSLALVAGSTAQAAALEIPAERTELASGNQPCHLVTAVLP